MVFIKRNSDQEFTHTRYFFREGNERVDKGLRILTDTLITK